MEQVHLFYNDMADRLGLPRAATVEGWHHLGRRVLHASRARFIESGVPFYGLESTYYDHRSSPVEEKPAKSSCPCCGCHEGEEHFAFCVSRPSDEELAQAIAFITRNHAAAEKKHPRLTWADSKPADRWEGFTVTSDSNDILHTLADGVHPTQKLGDSSNPLFGSAFLAVKG